MNFAVRNRGREEEEGGERAKRKLQKLKRIIRGIKRISIIPRSNKISPRTAWDINEDHRSSDGLVGASLVGHFSGSPRRVVILDAYPLFSPSVIRCLIETSESKRTSVRIYMHVRVYHLYVCVCTYVSLLELSSPSSPFPHPLVIRCPRDSVQFVTVLSPDFPFFLVILGFLSRASASSASIAGARRAHAKDSRVHLFAPDTRPDVANAARRSVKWILGIPTHPGRFRRDIEVARLSVRTASTVLEDRFLEDAS